jgi:mannosyltransferase OCH1-like enzyme
MPPGDPPHSTAYRGFFQTPPSLTDTFTQDPLLHRILRHYLSPTVLKQVTPTFASLANESISPQIQSYLSDTHHNLPTVIHWDGWGNRKDELRTPEGWKKLKEFWARSGLMEDFYLRPHGPQSRIVGFTK